MGRWLSGRNRERPMMWSELLRLEPHYGLPRTRVVHGLARGARFFVAMWSRVQ
jgi:hypothetical protein